MKIYTEAEFMAEKPKGRLILCAESGYWRVFQCHGCQTCWEYSEPDGTFENAVITQLFPHFLSLERLDIDTMHPEREYLVQPQDAV